MRTSTHLLLPLLFLAVTLASCFTPRSVVRMDADEANLKWSYGRQIVEQKKDSLEAQIYFDTYNKKDLIFDVEVTNWGSEDVLLSPEKIYVKCSEDDIKHFAFDPERELLDEEIDISRREADSKNLAVAVGVAVVATAVAVAVTSDGNGGGNNNNNDNNVVNNIANVTYVSTYVVPPLPAPFLPPSLDFWANYSLRKTTLEQNYKVGGKVVIPRLDHCPALEVYVPVGDETFVARFKQKIIQP